jgi:TetR/AcrR family transcriptional repressor of nem operon
MARKCEFDREEVLSNAMNLFWEAGYCQTSMAKLVEVTDLKPGSLYAAFDSKEGLFSSSLALYGQRSLKALQQCLAQADSPLQGVIAFIRQLGEEVINDQNRRGCFLVNTALEMSPHNERIRKQVNKQLGAIEASILAALASADESGELPRRYTPAVLAKHIMVNIWGVRVLGQTTTDKQAIRESLNILLSLFDPPQIESGVPGV